MSAPPRNKCREAVVAFVQRLVALAERQDRGALAALRRSLQDPTGMAASACPYVVPFLPKEPDLYRDRMYFLVAALFAQGCRQQSEQSLGKAFRRIQGDAGGEPSQEDSSTRARFVALLDADPEDVAVHVRHAVSLARAKEVGIDWGILLNDLLDFRRDDRRVQLRWAHDYWGSQASTDHNDVAVTQKSQETT